MVKQTLKHIGILEFHYHSIFFYTLARICKTERTHVTLFTTEKILKLIEPHLTHKQDYTIVVKKENESIHSFLKTVERICNESIDILFVNTIQESCKDLPHFIPFKPKSRMILTIHNVNSWLHPTFRPNLAKPLRTVDTAISSLLIKRNILPRYHAINVVYPPIKEYIVHKTNYSKQIYMLPFTFFDEQQPRSPDTPHDTIRIVIPGAIEQPRRDYESIIPVFHHLFTRFPKQLSLTILGRPVGPYGKKIISSLKNLQKAPEELTLFTEYIPEDIYDSVLSQSDIILSPIKIKAKGLGEIEEIYGMTKGTSSLFEAIQYAKPLIVPSQFQILEDLSTSTLQYDSADDLEEILIRLLKDTSAIEKLKHHALRNSHKFSLQTLQDYFQKEILDTN